MQESVDLQKQFDAGIISYAQFTQEAGMLAGVPAIELDGLIKNNIADKALLNYIAELKQNYRIGFLSNAGANFLDDFFTTEQQALFDALVMSYQNGYVKPDTRAYEAVATELDVLPSECVFIDDQQRNCIGAREAGMRAIEYQNLGNLRVQLKSTLL